MHPVFVVVFLLSYEDDFLLNRNVLRVYEKFIKRITFKIIIQNIVK